MFGLGRQLSGTSDIKRRAFSLPALVSVAVAGGFLLFLVTRFDVDLNVTWNQVKSSNPWLLAAAVLVHYTTFVFRGARWRLLLKNSRVKNSADAQQTAPTEPGVLYFSQLMLLGWFANAVGWLRLGDAYRAYLYRDEQGASFARTIGTILAERMLDALLVVLLLAAAMPFLIEKGGTAAWTVLAVAAIFGGLLAALLVAMTSARSWVSNKLPDWLAQRYSRFHQGTLGSFGSILPITVLGAFGWLAEVGRLYLVVQALNLGIGFPLVIFLTLANSLLTLVPTPGGLGAVEAGVAGLAVRLSTLSVDIAASLVVVDRAITYLSVIVVGALLFLLRQFFRRASPNPAGPARSEGISEGIPGAEG